MLQRKIHKTELLLLAQIGTKSFVGWGFAPDPTGAAYSAPDPLAGLGGGGARGKGNEEGKGEGKRKGGQRPRSQEAEVRFGGGMIVDLLGSRVKLENLKF